MRQRELIGIQGNGQKIKGVFTVKKLAVVILVGIFCLSAVSGFAQGSEREWGRQSRDRGGFEGKHKQRIESLVVFATLDPEERAALLKLRQEDKEEFNKVIGIKIRDRARELYEIKQADPQEFELMKQAAVEEVKGYAKQIKEDIEVATRFKKAAGRVKGKQELGKHIVLETLPDKQKKKIVALREKYRQTLDTALEERTQELELLKKENPEEFKKIISQAIEGAKERMAKGRRQRPEAFKRFEKMKPEYLKEKLDWLKSEDPELYQYLIKRGSTEQKEPR
ncbi:MAG: hypothetical protein K9L86_03165 [Candidatus Omnitrophica bacterium]|nr:hypothetical protein [Candidatus Omnitrophota bacterium]